MIELVQDNFPGLGSEDWSTVVPKLFAIMEAAPRIAKDGEMELGGSKKLKFLAIDDVLDKLRPIFVEQRVLSVPRLVSGQTHIAYGQLPDVSANPQQWSGKIPTKSIREKVVYEWVFIDVDNPTSFLTARVEAEAMDTQDKASNKAVTAAFKVVLTKLFMLITGEPEIEDGQTDDAEPKVTRGQQMTQKAKPLAEKTVSPAPQVPPEPKPSVSTDPRPAKVDPLAKAKEGLRELVAITGLTKEEVDDWGQKILHEPRSTWVVSSVKINKLVKGIQQGVGE